MKIKSYVEQIKEEAEARGLTLKQAFDLAEVHHSQYYRIKSGLRADIHIDTANRIMEALVDDTRTGTTA